MLNKGTASLEVKNSERNRELENSASLEPRVCEVLLYIEQMSIAKLKRRGRTGLKNQKNLQSVTVCDLICPVTANVMSIPKST